MPAYSEEYDTLTKHDLIRYEEKLRVIRDNCETEFRESFLAKMRENIENAVTLFKNLNKTLRPIYYGNDSYRSDRAADKKKKRLYEMIVSDLDLGGSNLFSTQFDKEYHDEMNELFSKLTASDEHGDDVIREYTDHRSYLDHDIEIISRDGRTQKFSKIYREKSGGETQTPIEQLPDYVFSDREIVLRIVRANGGVLSMASQFSADREIAEAALCDWPFVADALDPSLWGGPCARRGGSAACTGVPPVRA